MLLKFEVYRDGRSWGARALGHGIFTQARTLDKLYENIKEAAHLHFEEEVEKGETLEILISEMPHRVRPNGGSASPCSSTG